MTQISNSLSNAPSSELDRTRLVELTGRILMGSLFFIAGLRKLFLWAGTVAYFTKLGLPLPEVTAVLVISLEIAGSLLLVAGWRTRIVAWALAAFTMCAALVGHQFWAADAAQYSNQLNHFLKNMAVVGGLLYMAELGASLRNVVRPQ